MTFSEDLHQEPIEERMLEVEDYEAVIDLQKRCFPGMKVWTKSQFKSQLKHFQEGQIGFYFDGKLVASSSSLIIDIDEYADNHDWETISDDGYIRNHDPEADTLYGIEVMVDPEYRDLRFGSRIYEARKQLCTRLNLRRILVGGRIPGYKEHMNDMDVRTYVNNVIKRKLYDPVLSFQLKHGFNIKRINKDYLEEDKESAGYGILLEWVNLEFQPNVPKRKVTSHPVKVCCVQYQMRKIGSFEDFAKQVEYFVDVASDYKSDFVLFPELLTTQLLSFIEEKRPAAAARELTKYTDQYIELFRDLAIGYNINIIGGSHFELEHDDIYNVSYLFRRDGTFDRQYKIHTTPSERRWWGLKAGNKLQVFDTDRARIAILICYDSEFPELARIAVERGAQIIFVPFCTDVKHGYIRVSTCAQARAIENQIYTAIAGTVGNIPSIENMDVQYAQSAIFTPSDFPFARDGVAAIADANTEMVVIADLDLELLRRNRHSGTVTLWNDRRLDLYKLVMLDQWEPPKHS